MIMIMIIIVNGYLALHRNIHFGTAEFFSRPQHVPSKLKARAPRAAGEKTTVDFLCETSYYNTSLICVYLERY